MQMGGRDKTEVIRGLLQRLRSATDWLVSITFSSALLNIYFAWPRKVCLHYRNMNGTYSWQDNPRKVSTVHREISSDRGCCAENIVSNKWKKGWIWHADGIEDADGISPLDA